MGPALGKANKPTRSPDAHSMQYISTVNNYSKRLQWGPLAYGAVIAKSIVRSSVLIIIYLKSYTSVSRIQRFMLKFIVFFTCMSDAKLPDFVGNWGIFRRRFC